MEQQKITAMAIMDLSAAFDTVDHDVLLHILDYKFGLDESALEWFDSYLRPRAIQVKVRKEVSEPKSISFSVPQGSVAGAVIFNYYSSTLDEKMPTELNLNGFADDHSVRTVFDPKLENAETLAISRLEGAMNIAKNWMNSVRLKMNASKTEFIYFGNNTYVKNTRNTELSVNGNQVPRSKSVRLLGAWLDTELCYKTHVSMKCRTAMLNFQRIKAIRPFLDTESCQTLVLTLCISHIDYANSLLVGLPDVTTKKLQRVQNMCAKLVLGLSKYDSSTDALR
jgi:hypothetical protein